MQVNDPEALELTFHQGLTFINAYFQLYTLRLFPSQIVHYIHVVPCELYTFITYFLEIYEAEELKLIYINYLMLHSLLSFRGNTLCYLCKQYEENLDHLLFHCPFLTQSRELVKGWLRLMGCQSFNRQTVIEMTGIRSGIENFAISTYKYVIWKNRNIAELSGCSWRHIRYTDCIRRHIRDFGCSCSLIYVTPTAAGGT